MFLFFSLETIFVIIFFNIEEKQFSYFVVTNKNYFFYGLCPMGYAP